MKYVVFTKHLEGMSVPQLIEAMNSVGAAGVDLCVRPGYPVNPDNVSRALPAAAKKFAQAGQSIGLVTTPGEFTNPRTKYAEPLFAACAKAGVGLIKLGYWHVEDDGYWATVDRVRRGLAGFAKLAEKYGVKACVHNHSGNSMGLNSCAAMNLMKGFDPAHLGVFADTGHLSLVGEPLPMALDIVKEYLSIIALKDVIRERRAVDGKSAWQTRIVPLGQGFVDWPTLAGLLKEMKYRGPLSFHSEYGGVPQDTVIDQCRIDIRFFNGVCSQVHKATRGRKRS